MSSRTLATTLSLLLAAGWLVAQPVQAEGPSRVDFVGKLIETSSGAKQIENSGNAEAIAKREVARATYQKAVDAHKAGDTEQSNKLLGESVRQMSEAVRLADRERVEDEKKRRDFQNRLESVNALLDAHTRVSDEKGERSSVHKDIETDKKRAEALYAAGKIDEGKQVLDEAYMKAKVAIEKLRGGDTLVRSLNFANKAEEYDYEKRRNDDYVALIESMVAKSGNPSVVTMAKPFQEKAQDLRNQAEKAASKNDHENALPLIEESTKQFKRALLAAGFTIPG